MNKFKILSSNLQALYSYYQKKIVLKNLPTYIWLEPTNHCNLHCVMCPNGAGKVDIEKGYMDFSLFSKIIDDISAHTSAVTLAVGGESLLHPRFIDMVKYCKTKSIKVLLNTNATMLAGKYGEDILESGIDYISFAFDGYNKQMYEKARKGASYEKTLANITTFLLEKKRKKLSNPYCVFSILKLGLNNYTPEEKSAFVESFSGLVDEIREREVATWGSTFKDEDSFSHRTHDGVFPPCSRLWSTACISWNGDVIPCIYNANHEYVLGNMRTQDLQQIWNGEAMLDLRQSMLDNSYIEKSPLCENCIVLGSPPILSIPSGLRLTLADAAVNFLGYGFEKLAIKWIGFSKSKEIASKSIDMT